MTRPDPSQHEPSPLPPSQEEHANELSSLESPAWWASSPSLSFFVRHQRLLSWLGALALTLTLMGGLFISQISARHGLLVFGSDPALWCAGGRAALRVEARALTLGERAALLSAQVRFERPRGLSGSHVPPQPLPQRLGVSLQGGIALPKEGGEWLMVIETEALSAAGAHAALLKEGLPERLPQDLSVIGERVSLRATLTLQLASTPSAPIPALEAARTPDLLAERQGEHGELASFAAGQRLSFELPSEVIVMGVAQKHTPLTGPISMELNGQAMPPLTLNEDGLASFVITPQSPTIDLTLTRPASEEQGERLEVKERLWPEAHQFSLTPSTQRVSPELTPMVSLKSTQAARALFVDLWWGERWIDTFIAPLNEAREGSLRLTLPKLYEWGEPALMKGRAPSPQLLWAQTYHSPYQPGEVRGGAYLLYAPAPQTEGELGASEGSDQALGAWLQRELEGFKLTQKRWPHLAPERWLQPLPLRLALGRIKRPDANPQLIINSLASAAATASEMKARYQVRFLLVMLAMGALTLLGLGGLMWAHERHLSALSESLELRRNRWEVLGWLVQVTFVLSCFFGGMIYLIYVIRW